MLDCAGTASIWWYLVQLKITDKFLFAISAVWVFAICALVALLVYVLSELNDQLLSLSRLHKQ
jgi:hypothetical protein